MTALDSIKSNLELRLKEIGAEVARLDAETGQALEADWEEQANQIEEMETAEGLGAVRMEEAADIRAALRRISDGTYGTCANCGGQIAPARLQALPTAALCIGCAP